MFLLEHISHTHKLRPWGLGLLLFSVITCDYFLKYVLTTFDKFAVIMTCHASPLSRHSIGKVSPFKMVQPKSKQYHGTHCPIVLSLNHGLDLLRKSSTLNHRPYYQSKAMALSTTPQ